MEATPRIELGIKVLQTSALPLGYVALKGGAENEIRTRDPLLGKEVLYHWAISAIWCLSTESNCGHKDFQSFALPTELPRHDWRPGWDSNPRPPPWQGGILTNWTTGPINYELYYTGLSLFCQHLFILFLNLPMQPSIFPLYAPAKPAVYPLPARCPARQKCL